MNGAQADLRGFLEVLRCDHPREYLCVDDALSGDWELATVTAGLEQRLRTPVIEYRCVDGGDWPVVHNVCASLSRIARVMGWRADELERRLEQAYEHLIPPRVTSNAPVREIVETDERVDLSILPGIRYTEQETHPYLSAACLVARDEVSGAFNLSVHRLMRLDERRLAIYMTPGGDLDTLYQRQRERGLDTPVAAFIGAHPLWSLGSLAAGPLELDEYEVIGGLLGAPLEVTPGLVDERLLLPARAEIVLEGYLSASARVIEGPYGEAFGYTSAAAEQPIFEVRCFTRRQDALFQDIVPGKIEHLTMTGVAIKAHLRRTLLAQYACIDALHLPAPMTLYLGVHAGTRRSTVQAMIREVLIQQRFVKQVVVFDAEVRLDNHKQTQRALAMHVQADRDVLVLPDQRGNGLDPSERDGRTTKWGVDATSSDGVSAAPVVNRQPTEVVQRIDVDALFKRAQAANS